MKNRKITPVANHEGDLRSGQEERLRVLLSEESSREQPGGNPPSLSADAPVDPQVPYALYVGK